MKTLRLICCLCLLVVLLAIGLPGIALAQDEEQPTTENVTLAQEEQPEEPKVVEELIISPTFPTVEAVAGSDFKYEMELQYIGPEAKVFDLRTTAPAGWDVYMTPRYEPEKKISSINLKPSFSTGESIIVVATAPFWPLPEPGDYKVTVEAVSTTLENSVELTARITAKYVLQTIPAIEQRYNTTAESGKDNFFSIKIQNLGTANIDNIKFSSDKPDGWSIGFTPDKIDVLNAIDEQTVEVNIKPPPKAVAGDYMISLRASGQQATATEMSIRVTVETPTIWGWVGVVIILIVVIGLVIIFMRFSRR